MNYTIRTCTDMPHRRPAMDLIREPVSRLGRERVSSDLLHMMIWRRRPPRSGAEEGGGDGDSDQNEDESLLPHNVSHGFRYGDPHFSRTHFPTRKFQKKCYMYLCIFICMYEREREEVGISLCERDSKESLRSEMVMRWRLLNSRGNIALGT